jgi:hypothetical protein
MLALAFNVPIILLCSAIQLSPTTYRVHEKSNNPRGYTVAIHSTVPFTYDGIRHTEEYSIVTDVLTQTVSVDVNKVVVLDNPGEITVECNPYE